MIGDRQAGSLPQGGEGWGEGVRKACDSDRSATSNTLTPTLPPRARELAAYQAVDVGLVPINRLAALGHRAPYDILTTMLFDCFAPQ
ncbi:MAG: hypothetical protein EAZ30_10495 [Betaproteobacteria bacterium]|nr:MAG: hypothetical protein EAZ30_10495 [Betaproteobacteria bacterium]